MTIPSNARAAARTVVSITTSSWPDPTHVEIKSLVMIPGSVSARDTSMDRLAAKLLAAVRAQQAETAGVVQLAPTDIAR